MRKPRMVWLAPVVPIALGLLVWTVVPRAQAPSSRWRASRTADGQPDLSGVWNYAAGTPLERPAAFAGREFLTDEELARAEKQIRQQSDADRRDGAGTDADVSREGNEFWFPRRKTLLTRRTSLIVDPPDGRLPAYTAEAQRRLTARAAYLRDHPADSWENRRLNERCIMWVQSGPPIVPSNGPNGELLLGFRFDFQIFQSREHVVIRHEQVQLRIIPLDGRPHVGRHTLQWLGDSRGHWEGETLVIETTNFRENRPYAEVIAPPPVTTGHLRLVERLTRLGPDTLEYRFTVEDPTTWTKPWTAVVPIEKSDGPLYEFACHEGNYGLPNILSGARAAEARAGEANHRR